MIESILEKALEIGKSIGSLLSSLLGMEGTELLQSLKALPQKILSNPLALVLIVAGLVAIPYGIKALRKSGSKSDKKLDSLIEEMEGQENREQDTGDDEGIKPLSPKDDAPDQESASERVDIPFEPQKREKPNAAKMQGVYDPVLSDEEDVEDTPAYLRGLEEEIKEESPVKDDAIPEPLKDEELGRVSDFHSDKTEFSEATEETPPAKIREEKTQVEDKPKSEIPPVYGVWAGEDTPPVQEEKEPAPKTLELPKPPSRTKRLENFERELKELLGDEFEWEKGLKPIDKAASGANASGKLRPSPSIKDLQKEMEKTIDNLAGHLTKGKQKADDPAPPETEPEILDLSEEEDETPYLISNYMRQTGGQDAAKKKEPQKSAEPRRKSAFPKTQKNLEYSPKVPAKTKPPEEVKSPEPEEAPVPAPAPELVSPESGKRDQKVSEKAQTLITRLKDFQENLESKIQTLDASQAKMGNRPLRRRSANRALSAKRGGIQYQGQAQTANIKNYMDLLESFIFIKKDNKMKGDLS